MRGTMKEWFRINSCTLKGKTWQNMCKKRLHKAGLFGFSFVDSNQMQRTGLRQYTGIRAGPSEVIWRLQKKTLTRAGALIPGVGPRIISTKRPEALLCHCCRYLGAARDTETDRAHPHASTRGWSTLMWCWNPDAHPGDALRCSRAPKTKTRVVKGKTKNKRRPRCSSCRLPQVH